MGVSFESTSVRLLASLTSEVVDPDSWERFVYLYGPQIVQWCRDHGLQEADALDVAQEVLLRVARQIRQLEYDPERRFRGWLYTVIRGAWVDWVKARRRRVGESGASEALRRLAAPMAREELLSRMNARYDRELFERAATQVRQRVSPTSWQAFELQALHEQSAEEVGQKLGITRGSAWAARCRIQKLIRQEIDYLERPE